MASSETLRIAVRKFGPFEDAIRRQLQAIAVFGTFSTSPTGQYSGGQVSALIGTAMTLMKGKAVGAP